MRRADITPALMSRLVAAQFPRRAGLPVRPVPGGWDNATFRLGEHLSVRLPSAERYAAQVGKIAATPLGTTERWRAVPRQLPPALWPALIDSV